MRRHDAAARTYDLTLAQSLDDGEPLVIPVALGLVAPEGGTAEAASDQVRDGVFVLDAAEASARVGVAGTVGAR